MSMPALTNLHGAKLKDAAGNEIKVDDTVTDTMFGDGIVRGTVPQEKGEGVNVTVGWLGPNVSNYGHGEAARFDSWVILQQT
jgi:hypothetical protein